MLRKNTGFSAVKLGGDAPNYPGEKVKLFLLELGKGFTFIGNQHTLEYNGKESRVDMLFFHV